MDVRSHRNAEAIYKLGEHGTHVFLATGRHYELTALFKEEAEVIDWNDGFELIAPHISKWSAIQSLLTEFQLHSNEVVAIGDGPNDIEMLRQVGMGVAMVCAEKYRV